LWRQSDPKLAKQSLAFDAQVGGPLYLTMCTCYLSGVKALDQQHFSAGNNLWRQSDPNLAI
jgi:hypothetical protein